MGTQADSLKGRMEQLRYQYQQMQVPGECLNEDVKTRMQAVMSLQLKLQATPEDEALQAAFQMAVHNLQATMERLQCRDSSQGTSAGSSGSGSSSAS